MIFHSIKLCWTSFMKIGQFLSGGWGDLHILTWDRAIQGNFHECEALELQEHGI